MKKLLSLVAALVLVVAAHADSALVAGSYFSATYQVSLANTTSTQILYYDEARNKIILYMRGWSGSYNSENITYSVTNWGGTPSGTYPRTATSGPSFTGILAGDNTSRTWYEMATWPATAEYYDPYGSPKVNVQWVLSHADGSPGAQTNAIGVPVIGAPAAPAVTFPTPEEDAAAYVETFRNGFFTGLAWELFGLMIAFVRRLRAGTGMEN